MNKVFAISSPAKITVEFCYFSISCNCFCSAFDTVAFHMDDLHVVKSIRTTITQGYNMINVDFCIQKLIAQCTLEVLFHCKAPSDTKRNVLTLYHLLIMFYRHQHIKTIREHFFI